MNSNSKGAGLGQNSSSSYQDTGARPKYFSQSQYTQRDVRYPPTFAKSMSGRIFLMENELATSDPKASNRKDTTTMTFEGNNRKVTLEQGWDIVHCKLVCEKHFGDFDIYGEIHPCILQYLTSKNMIYDINKLLPTDMKVTVVAPKALEIKMKTRRPPNDVMHILLRTVANMSLKEVNFASQDEFKSVVLDNLDKQKFFALTSFELGRFYYPLKDKFLLMIVWPVFNYTGNDYQNLAQELEDSRRLVQRTDSVDRLKPDMQITKKQVNTRLVNCSLQESNELKFLGVFNELKRITDFDLNILQYDVEFICQSKDQIDHLVSEFKVYVSRLRRIDVDFLPVETWDLLLKLSDKGEKVLKQQVKCDFHTFVVQDDGNIKKLLMLCISNDTDSTLYWSLKDCFCHKGIFQEIHQLPMVRQYLNEIKDDICVYTDMQQPDVVQIYYMLYMNESLSRLRMTDVDFLPMEAWSLLLAENARRDECLMQQLECEANFLVVDGCSLMMVCISQKDVGTIKEILQKNIQSTSVSSENLQQPKVLQYLNNNKESICGCKEIEKPNYTCLHVLRYRNEKLCKYLNVFAERCDAFMSRYLLSKGGSLLKELEHDHNVTTSVSEHFIEFPTGLSGDGSSMMKALNSQLQTVLHHEVDTKKCLNIACSYDLKVKLTQIEDKHSCCLKSIPVITNEKLSSTCKGEGVDYRATWYLRDMKNCVSVVCGEVKNMPLDFLIVPVNSSFVGEDLLTAQGNMATLVHYFPQYKEKAKLGEILMVNFGYKMKPKHVVATVVSGTEMICGAERRVILEGNKMQDVIKNVIDKIRNTTYGQVSNIGVYVPQDETQFSLQFEDFIEPFHKTTMSQNWHLHFCVKSNVEKWIQMANICSQGSYRRVVHSKDFGIFSTPDNMSVEVTETSLLDVKAECLVVSVGSDFNLAKGFVAKLINNAAGPELQNELNNTKYSGKKTLILAARPWRLSNKGVKLLLFVNVPHWKSCDRKTENLKSLVEESLLTADKYYCKSVAFPVFGIGNLEYPMRDVTVALFDAIETFKKESIVQAISKIHISAPVIDQKNYVFELLKKEEKRRSNCNLKYCVIFEPESMYICCLKAGDENVILKVVKKSDLQLIDLSGEYVHVKLDTSQADMKPRALSLYEVIFQCGKTKDELKKAMEDVVKYCENQRITSIVVSLHTGFRFCESDQIRMVSEAVRKTVHSLGFPEHVYRYLKHIYIMVSDAFTFVPETLSYIGNRSWHPFSAGPVDYSWKRILYPKATYAMNIVIIGTTSSVQKALKDVHKLLSTSGEESEEDFHDALEEHGANQNSDDDEYKSIKQEPVKNDRNASGDLDETVKDISTSVDQAETVKDRGTTGDLDETVKDISTSVDQAETVKDIGTSVDQAEVVKDISTSVEQGELVKDIGTSVDQAEVVKDISTSVEQGELVKDIGTSVDLEENLIDDEDVMAEINFGLVRFLKSPDFSFYEKWVKEIENKFGIQVETDHSSKLFVKGKLDKLLNFEQYIENDFPNMDEDGDSELRFDEQHYPEEQQLCPGFLVPMLRGNAEDIQRKYHEEYGKFVRKFEIKYCKIVDNGFFVSCPKKHKSEIPQAFLDLKGKLFRESESLENLDFDVSKACLKFRNVAVTVVCSDIINCNVGCIVSPVNAEMHHGHGIARSLAQKAGQLYIDECKSGKLKTSKCKHMRLDQSKQLKCQGILNVNCFPASGNIKDVNFEYLSELRTCLSNCFEEAEMNQYSSMALPMLRTGQLGLDVSLCAQECFRAIDDFSFQHLRELLFVSNDSKNVKTFVKTLAATSSSTSGKESMLFSSLEVRVKSTSIHILHEDKMCPNVEAKVQFDGVLKQGNLEKQITCRTEGPVYLLTAPKPPMQHNSDLYKRGAFDVVQCVLLKAKKFKLHSLALPIAMSSDAMEATAMLQAVCKFCKENHKAMEFIQMISSDQSLIANILDMVVWSLPDHSK